MNPEIDLFLSKAKKWQPEMEQLRMILLDCGLKEEMKWSKPCYSFDNCNIVVIQGFKAYLAILFFKGYLLKDAHNVLVKTGENTVVGRQIRFQNVQDVIEMQAIIRQYITEAIELKESGVKVERLQKQKIAIPEEFQNKLMEYPALKSAFDGLTPGRQSAYLYYFSAPKQSKTRQSRVEKYLDQIMDGKGMLD